MRVYDRFADEYIDEMEKDPIAPPERYIELSEELILQNAARWFCQALCGKRDRVMDKVFIKKNTLGDTRTAEYMPSREEFNDANERHIDDVKNLTRSFCDEMLKRISHHDWTKMSEPYATMFYDNMRANIEDGKEPFTDMEWYKLHVNTERHHLNDRVPDDVDLIDVVERVVDCVSAGMARSGSVYDVTVPDDVLQKAVANTVKKMINAVIVYESVDEEKSEVEE